MKKCIRCGEEKDLSDFYLHKQMGDGHLNKCKSCCKEQQKIRTENLSKSKDWVESERKRARDKAKKYKYHLNVSNDKKMELIRVYRNRYPEKYKAKNVSQHLVAQPGMEKHHWSYKEEHYKDIIELSKDNHSLIHRYTIYDSERMMYRNLNGELLDTKSKYTEYMNCVFNEKK